MMCTFFSVETADVSWVEDFALLTIAKTMESGLAACWTLGDQSGLGTRIDVMTDQLADIFQSDATRGSDDSERRHVER